MTMTLLFFLVEAVSCEPFCHQRLCSVPCSIKLNTLSSQELKFTLAVSIKCNLIQQETHFISNVDIEESCIAFLPIEMTVIHQLLFHFVLLWCSISQRNALISGKVYPLSSFPCCLSSKKYFL